MKALKVDGTADPSCALQVRDWCVWYGQAQVLFDVNVSITQGECVALLGRNGAGKSTLLQSVFGLKSKRRGSVHLLGQDLKRMQPYELARLGLGWVPEDRRIFAQLTVLENLRVGFRGVPQESFIQKLNWAHHEQQFVHQLEQVLSLFPLLRPLLKRLGGHLSGGEQQMLSIARTLMSQPRWIFLDEVSEGVAPQVLDRLKESVLKMSQMGVSILMAEQNIDFVHGLCSKAYVIERGRVVGMGDQHQLSNAQWVQSQLKHLS